MTEETFNPYHNDYEYRFVSARGLERRKVASSIWFSVEGAAFEYMTAGELRHCADVMDHALTDQSS